MNEIHNLSHFRLVGQAKTNLRSQIFKGKRYGQRLALIKLNIYKI